MSDDEGEIEYLDEDEDLVQQYVQNTQSLQDELILPAIQNVRTISTQDIEVEIAPLLVERKPSENRRRQKTENDSDYDPSEDLIPQRKKRRINTRKNSAKEVQQVKHSHLAINKFQNTPTRTYVNKLKSLPNLTVKKQNSSAQKNEKPLLIKEIRPGKPLKKSTSSHDLYIRKKMDIRISDYEDPLCLPVKATKKDELDLRKLRQWNNLCLAQYKKSDTMFKPDRGKAVSSTRTVVLRNMKNKNTGKMDTTIWGKTIVENEKGEKKTEKFQSVLPKFREKKVLPSYPLIKSTQKHFKHTYEAILTKEDQKDGEFLVVYKPRDAISAVYKFLDYKHSDDGNSGGNSNKPKVLKELTCCKLCAPCYQSSWRGVRKRDTQQSVRCVICSRSFVSVYNLLSHVRTSHSPEQVRAKRAHLSRTLASMVDYHYKCRICQEQFISIKLLRKHVTRHQGMEVFRCEVGNHMAS